MTNQSYQRSSITDLEIQLTKKLLGQNELIADLKASVGDLCQQVSDLKAERDKAKKAADFNRDRANRWKAKYEADTRTIDRLEKDTTRLTQALETMRQDWNEDQESLRSTRRLLDETKGLLGTARTQRAGALSELRTTQRTLAKVAKGDGPEKGEWFHANQVALNKALELDSETDTPEG